MSAEKRTVKAFEVPIAGWQTLSMSGFAGMFAWCFAHPFEMWKNTTMMAAPGVGSLSTIRATANKGFYTGLSSGLARQVVYATARLGCYPIFRDAIVDSEVSLGLRAKGDRSASLAERAVAGAAAGVFASFLSSPIEVCLVLQTTGAEKLSILGAGRSVIQNSGFSSFWRGFGALGSRAALVGISQVAVHDQVLTTLRGRNVMRPKPLNDNLVVNIASVVTALFYSIVTMPVECARVRMSAEAKLSADVEKKYHNALQCIGRIAREEGVRAMYGAFLPYFARCAMHTVICFFTIEFLSREVRRRKAASMGYTLVEA